MSGKIFNQRTVLAWSLSCHGLRRVFFWAPLWLWSRFRPLDLDAYFHDRKPCGKSIIHNDHISFLWFRLIMTIWTFFFFENSIVWIEILVHIQSKRVSLVLFQFSHPEIPPNLPRPTPSDPLRSLNRHRPTSSDHHCPDRSRPVMVVAMAPPPDPLSSSNVKT